VEDAAFILPEVAVITRPGADSRKPETESIIRALSPYRTLVHVTEPASVDGGDVLVLGKNIYIGLSTRSNMQAVNQLNSLLDKFGYKVHGVELTDCLHLKTAVTRVDDKTLLINKNWVDASHFNGFRPDRSGRLRTLRCKLPARQRQNHLPDGFPNTQRKLEEKGFSIVNVNLDELAKAEGAVTCCSLIIEVNQVEKKPRSEAGIIPSHDKS
jgi:dimethylargininase